MKRSRAWRVTLVTLLVLLAALAPAQKRVQGDAMSTPDLLTHHQEAAAGGRTLSFAGQTWNVKSGCGMGPGPNCWSDDPASVWTDFRGLHLKVRQIGEVWHSAEVWTTACTGYGGHKFELIGRPDLFDQNVVLGLFLYQDDLHEIDVEFARWGVDAPPTNAQYVVQPWDKAGNRWPFPVALNGTSSTHEIDWAADQVRFESLYGHYDEPPDPQYVIQEWTYQGEDIPDEAGCLHVHINLWLYEGQPPVDAQEAEIIIHSVRTPAISPPTTTHLFLPTTYKTSP